MKKRLFTTFLALLMVLGALPVHVNAASAGYTAIKRLDDVISGQQDEELGFILERYVDNLYVAAYIDSRKLELKLEYSVFTTGAGLSTLSANGNVVDITIYQAAFSRLDGDAHTLAVEFRYGNAAGDLIGRYVQNFSLKYAADYPSDKYVNDSSWVSVNPVGFSLGTVDPVLHVTAPDDFDTAAAQAVVVETGTTELTVDHTEVNPAHKNRLSIYLTGRAQLGTITIVLDGEAFGHLSYEPVRLSVSVFSGFMSSSENGAYQVTFLANDGSSQRYIYHICRDTEYPLPACTFDAPEGKQFLAWSIGGQHYHPDEVYTFTGNTSVEALWDDTAKQEEPAKDEGGDADYEEEVGKALDLIEDYVSKMTDNQKSDSDDVDIATLYAENVIADAVSIEVTELPIVINDELVSDLAAWADIAVKRAEEKLIQGGVEPRRELSATITVDTKETDVEIKVEPNLLASGADKVRVRTPDYALTYKADDLEIDLTNTLTFKAKLVDAETLAMDRNVDVSMSGGSTANPITVALPADKSKSTTYQAVVKQSTGAAVTSKYNPVTDMVEGKINASDVYAVKVNEVDFTDIANKDANMKAAIKDLASHGISLGTSATTFSPDDTISREQLTTLIVRALGKVDSKATTKFTDIAKSSPYYTAIASSQRLGYINGYEDNTFRGGLTINKEQIVVISGRVLVAEMKYKIPSNTATYLNRYSDTVSSWAQPQVALATRENLVAPRANGTFSGASNMTRGDAAVIISQLFKKIW